MSNDTKDDPSDEDFDSQVQIGLAATLTAVIEALIESNAVSPKLLGEKLVSTLEHESFQGEENSTAAGLVKSFISMVIRSAKQRP